MRVALTTDGRNISKELAKTTVIEMYDINKGKLVGKLKIDVSAGGGYRGLLYILENEGVDVLLCGEVKGEEKKDLEDCGMQVFSGAKGSVNKTLNMYLRGLNRRSKSK